jgi:hypothetical protein
VCGGRGGVKRCRLDPKNGATRQRLPGGHSLVVNLALQSADQLLAKTFRVLWPTAVSWWAAVSSSSGYWLMSARHLGNLRTAQNLTYYD